MRVYHTFAEALIAATRDVIQHGQNVSGVTDVRSIGSGYGTSNRPFRELMGYSFTIEDPLSTLLWRPFRPINVPYLLANLLWTLSGSDRVAEIEYWNPRAGTFSDDGSCIRSALGPRLFGGADQFAHAKARIQSDPDSRRGMMMLLEPRDLTSDTRDVPCVASLQFLLRDGALHGIGTMRSQSALMVMPYDVPLLCGLLFTMASELGVEVGTYQHFSGSFHYYEDEEPVAQDVAAGNVTSHRMPGTAGLGSFVELAATFIGAKPSSDSALRMSMELDDLAEPVLASEIRRAMLGTIVARYGHSDIANSIWSNGSSLSELCRVGAPKT